MIWGSYAVEWSLVNFGADRGDFWRIFCDAQFAPQQFGARV